MYKKALNLVPKNAEASGALAGGLIGGTAGHFLADAFWDQPTRLQRLISGVTGLIIGSAGGLATVKLLNKKNQPNALTSIKDMKPEQAQQLGIWQKAWKGIDDPDQGNTLSSITASIMHRLRNASPVDQNGDFSYSTAIAGVAGGLGAKHGFTRYVQQGFQNARDFRELQRKAKANNQNLGVKNSDLDQIFLRRKKLNKILDTINSTMPAKSRTLRQVNTVRGYIPNHKHLWRSNRSKRLGRIGHGAGLLSALISATTAANTTGFNADRNRIKKLLEAPK